MQRLTINAALAGLLLLLAGCGQRGATETLWLGHVGPMSGSEKIVGDPAKQGIGIAVDDLNADTGNLVLGRKIAVRHADAKSDARDAEAEAVRLASVNRVVALLGGTDTAQAIQVARGAEASGVPVVLQAALPSPSENAFAIVPSLARRGQVLGKFLAAEKKANKCAIFVDEQGSAAGAVADAFMRELAKETPQRLTFKKPEEFVATMPSLATAKPHAVVFVGSGRDLPRFRAEVQKVLPDAMILFGGEESSLPVLLGERTASDNVYLATSYIATDETPANQEFARKYQEQFHEPPDVNAALACDGTRLLCDGLRKAASINAVKLREALSKTEDFESVTGPMKFGEDRHARRPLFVIQIQNGQVVLRKRYGPDD